MKTITKICIKMWTLKKNQNCTKSPWNGTLYSTSGLRPRNIHNNVVGLSKVICFSLKVQRKTSSIHLRGLQISNLNAPNIKHTPYWHCFYSNLLQGNQPPHSILVVHSSLSDHHTDTPKTTELWDHLSHALIPLSRGRFMFLVCVLNPKGKYLMYNFGNISQLKSSGAPLKRTCRMKECYISNTLENPPGTVVPNITKSLRI